jgi:hypothetical protein
VRKKLLQFFFYFIDHEILYAKILGEIYLEKKGKTRDIDRIQQKI